MKCTGEHMRFRLLLISLYDSVIARPLLLLFNTQIFGKRDLV